MNHDPPRLDTEVVVTLAVSRTAHFPDLESPALDPVLAFLALQHDHTMRNALQLQVVPFGGAVVEQENGHVASREISLQSQHLATIAQGVAGQHAQFRKRIYDDPLRLK